MTDSDERYLIAGDLDSPAGPIRTGPRTLPDELVRMIPGRLRALGLSWTLFFGLTLAIRGVMELLGFDPWPLGVYAAFVVALAASLGVVAAVARFRGRPPVLMWIGLGYEVLGALAFAAAENQAPYTPDQSLRPEVSWVGIWIIIYPLMVPSRTVHTVVASVIAWLMVPLSLLVFARIGLTNPDPVVYLVHSITGGLVVLLAIVPQRFVYRLGRKVQRLKEMGAYRLVRRIGRGGMGEVWLARHRMLARPAAIKLIRPRFEGSPGGDTSAHQLARFEQEAQSTAALRSPHTVELYDFGASRDGAFYYVMEYLDGVDLDALVKRFGPQPAERVIAILKQACHSLAEAHRTGLVHRDIKPANLMLCRYGDDLDFVKVLDFGMVKRTTGLEGRKSTLTGEGTITGTPAFMAPELAAGEQRIGGSTDLYALGCVAYWLLTGALVFEGPTPMAIVLKHINEAPAPPSRRSELEIPAELERIILQCLAKKPEERFATAGELAAALDRVALSRPWSEERVHRWWDTHLPDAAEALFETPDAEAAKLYPA